MLTWKDQVSLRNLGFLFTHKWNRYKIGSDFQPQRRAKLGHKSLGSPCSNPARPNRLHRVRGPTSFPSLWMALHRPPWRRGQRVATSCLQGISSWDHKHGAKYPCVHAWKGGLAKTWNAAVATGHE